MATAATTATATTATTATTTAAVAAAILKAADFAAQKHRDQRRKDPQGTPYINHPLGVAHILSGEGGVDDVAVLQAGLLHDTLEDTETSVAELVDAFGPQVATFVSEVSDDRSLTQAERKSQAVLRAPRLSPGAKAVALADKIYNLRDLNRCTPQGWTEERVHQYFEWSALVLRGLRGANAALEREIDKLLIQRGVAITTTTTATTTTPP
ncbi:guanosine-3',5'-bis(diphosphate) 3'-pyrophosphohydrolase MESH1 isoform X1 [Petromyzon marinus]|uniref:guanosine-3',5'-bis(diphosphate) 3'-pyrophosphohydrolase MESH1 isoform X1 n=1 Tax=Petromyzon marinus TaxID=7757 RepID=UPI003F71D227